MLLEVLRLIQQLAIYSPRILAKKMDIDESMAKQLLYQLQSMGYIKEEKIKNICKSNCFGCSSRCNKSPVKIMIITEKGRAALGENVSI